MRVILRIPDTEFSLFRDIERKEEKDDIYFVLPKKKYHGTVLYVAGMVEGDEDDLVCLGRPDGEDNAMIAFHNRFSEFRDAWNAAVKKALNN